MTFKTMAEAVTELETVLFPRLHEARIDDDWNPMHFYVAEALVYGSDENGWKLDLAGLNYNLANDGEDAALNVLEFYCEEQDAIAQNIHA